MSNLMRRNNSGIGSIFDDIDQILFGTPVLSAPRSVLDFSVVDSKEEEDRIIYAYPLPGVKKEDVSVNLVDGKIEIDWTKKILDKEEEGSKIFSISKGMIQDNIEAELQDGILYITVFKPEKAKSKQILLK